MSDRTKDDCLILTGGLPDSRPRDPKGEVRTPRGNGVPVFCIHCGASVGYAIGLPERIVCLCDACEEKLGGLPLPIVDPDYLQFRKKEA